MLKRTLGLALLLTTPVAVPVPAHAAGTGIGPVTIAWSDATHTTVKITWTESTPSANTLTLTNGSGGNGFGTTTAAQPNEYLVRSDSVFNSTDPAEKVWIEVADASGAKGRSVDFDRFNYGGGSVKLAFTADRKLQWTMQADTSVDGTPDDPLDLPKAYTYVPRQRVDNDPVGTYDCEDTELPRTSVPTGTAPNPGKPYNLSLDVVNEWGTAAYTSVPVTFTKSITLAGPAATPYGGTTTLTGVLTGSYLYESGHPPACEQVTEPVLNQPVVIQQRTSPTAPWTTVGTTKTDNSGKYTAVIKNPGHREYRVIRLETIQLDTAAYGGVGGSKSVRATTRVVSAKFIQPTVNLGTQPQAYLWVDPAGTQKAALQFKNASGAWQGVAYKTLYAGRGLLAFPWNKRGTTQFRWWVPATAAADATYSNAFTLTVR
ncbi:hypothetical protein [Kribbella italica]|uniref:Ig-like domain-containing protein n=1 Tax=Kribbella italica TaxID=1540520 RepID=A0A7W9J6V5_9ACTN|nr:hypothetical protein [Kribbella italica]MBB5836711.1 hypothetical protein [Kribbella italica]